ncbi:MAG: hypothetical protein IPO37_22070 [Saprospiraceae bacterium]|nr:hypothetical protein [Saprospiraceae bacterium]
MRGVLLFFIKIFLNEDNLKNFFKRVFKKEKGRGKRGRGEKKGDNSQPKKNFSPSPRESS